MPPTYRDEAFLMVYGPGFDHQVTWLLPVDGSVVLINIEAHLQPVPSPVIEQLSQIQEKVDSSESTARDLKVRSKEFSKVVEGIVLYDTDVRIGGSWKVETLVAPSVPVPSSDDVDFNREIWMNGLDTIVQYLNKRVDELEKLIGDIENRLESILINKLV